MNEMYLVSGGGRAQLKVWKMTFDTDDHLERRVIHAREVAKAQSIDIFRDVLPQTKR